MHLSKIEIKNYRNFCDTVFDIDEGLNVVVGPNNAGKSNFLSIVNFLCKPPSSNVEDINKNVLVKNFNDFKENAPEILITYTIKHILDYEMPDSALSRLQDFLVISSVDGNLEIVDGGEITKTAEETAETESDNEVDSSGEEFVAQENSKFKIEAKIVFKYQLQAEYEQDYKTKMATVTTFGDFYSVLKEQITSECFAWNCFNASDEKREFSQVRSIFDIQLVDAIRTVENIGVHTGGAIHEKIKESGKDVDLRVEINTKIKETLKSIVNEIDSEIDKDQDAIGILDGKNKFVSSFNFDRSFADFFSYELKDATHEYTLPLDYNGLGYNNLIEIRNLLKQKMKDDFNILLIEEPESHLHPNMQYKLLKYICGLKEIVDKKIKNQIIVTTHSSNISASAKLENIILIDYERTEDSSNVISLRAHENFVFNKDLSRLSIARLTGESDDDYNEFLDSIPKKLIRAKQHIEKFLDVTRSDLLFSQKIILTEGLVEKLLIPKFAEMLGKNLVNNHIVTVEVGGIAFNYFLPLFIGTSKRILCFSDCDFKYVKSINNAKKRTSLDKYSECVAIKKCSFFERQYSFPGQFKLSTQEKFGHTFETELFLENYDDIEMFKYLMKLVLPECVFALLDKKSIQYWKDNITLITRADTKTKVFDMINLFFDDWNTETDADKKTDIEKVFFAYLFYQYVDGKKGDFALSIASDDNIFYLRDGEAKVTGRKYLIIPKYVEEGLEWLLQ